MNRNKYIVILIFLLFYFQQSFAQLQEKLIKPNATLININQISAWVHSDGRVGRNPYTNSWGVSYPKGTASVVWQDCMVWGGFVQDGNNPELRTGGGMWSVGTVPGAILSKGIAEDTSSSDVRIWRIRRDWQTADLRSGASEYFDTPKDSVTQNQIDKILSQYEKDWNEWPWEKGAPFYDTNENGIMEKNEDPGLAYADQVVWFVANDLDNSTSKSPPIGLEEQVTLWAYNRTGSQLNDALQHIIFKQVKLIYKGRIDTPENAHIDSMFIGQFADTEIGNAGNDFGGCDTTLQLGYGYNSSSVDQKFEKFDIPPPAFGYTSIYERSKSEGSVTNLDFNNKQSYSKLKMSSFWLHATGGANGAPSPIGNYQHVIRLYNLVNGFFPIPEVLSFINPNSENTKFILPGDPVKGSGWIDGLLGIENHYNGYGMYGFPGAGVRYFSMNFGPFSIALGDTQEFVIAMVGGHGSGHLASVSVLKHNTIWARNLASWNFEIGLPEPESATEETVPLNYHLSQNYPNPVRSGTNIQYNLPAQRYVNLSIYNLLGQKVKTLVEEIQNLNSYSYLWDGKNTLGQRVPSGIYFYKMEAGAVILTKKLIVME